MLKLDDIRRTYRVIQSSIHRTQLMRLETLEEFLASPFPIYGKCENYQKTESFKIRGAFALLLQLTDDQRRSGVAVRSSGNFAQALAFAARQTGVSAQIVMPTTAPQKKIFRAREFGAEMHLHGTTHQEGYAYLERLVQSSGSLKVSSFDHRDVILGQGTCALEVVEELPDLKHFYAPVGGGGLMAGSALCLKESRSSIDVVGVEPEGASKCYLSMKEGKAVEVPVVSTIADGLRSPRLGSLNWPILEKYLDRTCLVKDSEIVSAMKLLYRDYELILEPSGVVSIAGLISEVATGKKLEGPVVCVLSGANVDLALFEKLVT